MSRISLRITSRPSCCRTQPRRAIQPEAVGFRLIGLQELVDLLQERQSYGLAPLFDLAPGAAWESSCRLVCVTVSERRPLKRSLLEIATAGPFRIDAVEQEEDQRFEGDLLERQHQLERLMSGHSASLRS